MPVIREYTQQLRSTGRIAPSGVDPTAGSAVARGIGELGAAAQYVGDQAELANERKDKSDLQVEVAVGRDRLTARIDEAVRTGEINDDDFVERYQSEAQQLLDKLSETKRSAAGRTAAQMNAAVMASEFGLRAGQAKATADGQQAVVNFGMAMNANRNALLRDPLQFNDMLAETRAAISDPTGPYGAVPAAARAKIEAEALSQLALSAVQGTVQTLGPALAKQQLLEGKWDAYLDADNKASLMDYVQRENTKHDESAEYGLRLQIDEAIKQGRNPEYLIRAGIDRKLFGADAAHALHDRWQTALELQRKVTAADATFRAGNEAEFFRAEPTIKNRVAEAWVAEQMQGYEDMDPTQRADVISRVVQKGARMNYQFEGIRGLLTATPHGQNFDRAAETYKSLESFDPYYASKYVSEDQRMRFDVYTNAIKGGATKETASEMAQNINGEAVAKAREFFRTEAGRPTVDSLRTKMKDIPWSFSDAINGQAAADAVMERATVMMAANPSGDIQEVVETARKNYEAQNVLVNKFWVPRQFADGVPSDEMDKTMTAVISAVPETLRARGMPVIDGAYVLAPDAHSDRDKRLQVYDPLGFPVPGLRFSAQDMRDAYRAKQAEAYIKKAMP